MPATQDAGGAQSAGPGPDGADAQPAGESVSTIFCDLAHVLMGKAVIESGQQMALQGGSTGVQVRLVGSLAACQV